METDQSKELVYYRGRVIRTPKWKELQTAVLKKLEKHTVLLFLMWFYEHLKSYLEFSKKRIPCKINICFFN